MDSRRRPSPRPLPRIIYIRRRVAAAVILLVVVALLIWLMVSLSHGSDNTSDEGTAVAVTDSATAATSTQSQSTPTTLADGVEPTATQATPTSAAQTMTAAQSTLVEPTTTVVSTAPKKNTCDLSDLIITASTNKAVYGPGEMPEFFMTVDNPTTADCVIDLDKNLLRFEVFNLKDNTRVWSDIDCNDSEGAGTVTIPAGAKKFYKAVWSRKGSAPGQCDNRRPVPVGGYYLHTLIGSNHSDAHPFNLN